MSSPAPSQAVPQHPDPHSRGGRLVTPSEAALLCGISIDTVRRRLHTDQLPGAVRDGDHEWSPWLIPVSGLVAAGLCGEDALEQVDVKLNADAQLLAAELAEARAAVATEEIRRRSAEERLAQANGEVEHLRSIVDRLLGRLGEPGRAA